MTLRFSKKKNSVFSIQNKLRIANQNNFFCWQSKVFGSTVSNGIFNFIFFFILTFFLHTLATLILVDFFKICFFFDDKMLKLTTFNANTNEKWMVENANSCVPKSKNTCNQKCYENITNKHHQNTKKCHATTNENNNSNSVWCKNALKMQRRTYSACVFLIASKQSPSNSSKTTMCFRVKLPDRPMHSVGVTFLILPGLTFSSSFFSKK